MSRVFKITDSLENMGGLKTGGQGSVYKARRVGEMITAVKLLPTPIFNESPDDKNFRDFNNEVEKLKKVNEKPNPNVVKILSSGLSDTGCFPFIEMEFIEGPDLEDLLKPPHHPVFDIKETIKVAEQLSNALAHCHNVDVKHGDIKSNNVKFNQHTGNYVLLDFGLAIMSDEQRRTSMRNAGAIEFMAPEQNEGRMLFQTDVYSFGVIIYELLAGSVPFPLKSNTETNRNTVMISHMETPPPDFMQLRRERLSEYFSGEERQHQADVPEWLSAMIYKCLEKDPKNRFANGMELHEFIKQNNARSRRDSDKNRDQLAVLKQQNDLLRNENTRLQELLGEYQSRVNKETGKQVSSIRQGVAGKVLTVGVVAVIILATLYFTVIRNNKTAGVQTSSTSISEPERQASVIGQFKVVSPRAYFHNEPDATTKRAGYLVPSNDVIAALDERQGFLYVEFTNGRGQTSKGWINKADLITIDEWARQKATQKQETRLTREDINLQLEEARILLAENEIKQALYIYNYLAGFDVVEAMYYSGFYALKGINPDLDCEKSLQFVKKASDRGFTPAKTTLAFLYIFAENSEVLQMNEYRACGYEKNFAKGTELLKEASIAGDSTATRLLYEIQPEQEDYDSTDGG